MKEEEVQLLKEQWTEIDDGRLDKLKEAILCSNPVMKVPVPNCHFYLQTDWSARPSTSY